MLLAIKVATHFLLYRMVAEINSERKLKLQRAKPKAAEGRMHLSNVRVIQRNLVYIIGLPLNLADEEVRSFSLLYMSGLFSEK